MNEMLLERSWEGMILATISTAALGAIPSPKPTAARDTHRPGMVPKKINMFINKYVYK